MLGAVTAVDPAGAAARAVYWVAVAMLNTLSLVSLFTGFRIRFFAYRLCPAIFTGCSILIALGMLL